MKSGDEADLSQHNPEAVEAITQFIPAGQIKIKKHKKDTFEQILEYEPDVVVYGMFLNDAEQSDGFRARNAYVNEWMEGRRPAARDGGLLDFVFERLDRRRLDREALRWLLIALAPWFSVAVQAQPAYAIPPIGP